MNDSYYRNPEIPRNDFYNDTVALQVNCTGKEINTNGTGARSMRCDYYLFYLFEGNVQISTPINQQMTAGDICIFDRNTLFFYHSCDQISTTHYFVHFTGKNALELINSCNLQVSTIYSMQASMQSYFEDIFKTFLLRDEFFDLDSSTKLISLLVSIGRCNSLKYELNKSNDRSRFAKSIAYIHDNFTTELTISRLAQMERLSESRYRTVFNLIYHQSPFQYITNLRINLACSFLSTSDISIEQISARSGYSDTHYFSRLFKKKVSMTPTEYRRKYNTLFWDMANGE